MWTLTSPDGSRVERYIVEFECRVRNITFVEKYMSVSASGGTGRVATSASCFGGLGQLYRVKVWAVSGPSVSKELVCTPDGHCREEGGSQTPTTQLITKISISQTLADNVGTDRPSSSPSAYAPSSGPQHGMLYIMKFHMITEICCINLFIGILDFIYFSVIYLHTHAVFLLYMQHGNICATQMHGLCPPSLQIGHP